MKPETVLKNLRTAQNEVKHLRNGAYYESEKIERGIDGAMKFIVKLIWKGKK